MFSPSICAPLCALAAYAVFVFAVPAVSTAPSLTVKTSTPDANADGLKNLKVIATITNAGGETLKLLNDPRGVLNPFPEDTFTITDPSGSRMSFNGATASYNPMDAAGLDDPSSFTVLAPGDSIDVTHDLFAAYNFAQSGAGEYSIEPSNLFTYVDTDSTPKDLYATVEGTAKFELSDDLRVAVSRRIHDKRASFSGCQEDDVNDLKAVHKEAKSLATESYRYLQGIKSGTPRYTKWFGEYNDTRKTTAQGLFHKISRIEQHTAVTYNCFCDDIYYGLYRAYYHRDHPGIIWLCDDFWQDDFVFQATTLVHEFTHLPELAGTKDHMIGREACMSVAESDPDLTISNADSYAFFSEEEYR